MRISCLIGAAIFAAASFLTACGDRGDKKISDTVEESNTQLYAALQDNDMPRIEMLADSMANYIDDLTPDETITVLMAYLEVHNDAARNNLKEKDLVTIRKFIDVYDIALTNNPNDFKEAMSRARDINNNVDLVSIVDSFRDRLAQYDALQGGEEGPEEAAAPARPDTTKSTAEKINDIKPADADLPEDQRPAE